ncbi:MULTISPECIES: type VII secretion protein EccE [Mycolicibacterium]|uniref:type VII secretion protein EccE n=1 Tax=Mycolicibacterium TaxID=1866885 RepID=UPI001F2C1409|nr:MULTISPECIES: type VII secretion protein EccE [Mycolicibacterium]
MATATEQAPQYRLLASTNIYPQRVLPLTELVLAQIVVVLAAVLWIWTRTPWWIWAGGAVLLIAVMIGRWRGVSLLKAAAARWAFVRGRRRRADLVEVPDAFDHVTDAADPDGGPYGFRWDGRTLVTVLRIEDKPEDLTVMEPGSTVSGEMVPLEILVECLRQFDLELDSIDVISHGSRSHGHTPLATVYDAVLGPLPAIAHRTVWVTIRFDPSRCPEAVGLRGGGRTGMLRTAMVATRRVANRLTEAGMRVRVLAAAEIGQAISQLCGGANLANLHEDWDYCADGNFRMTSFGLTRDILTTEGLGRLWTVPSYSTTVAISLRNFGADATGITGTARFDSFGPVNRAPVGGLADLPGRQLPALMASLPTTRPAHEVTPWCFGSASTDFSDIRIPASGCGQVIGADDYGRAVALPMFGPRIARVEISGSLHLVQQVVLRALALGARILVHTNRSGMWRDMIHNVDDSRLLWVTDFNRGALQAGSERNYTVAMFDGVPEAATRVGVTSIVVLPPGSAVSGGADVTLQQIRDEADRVVVTTRSDTAVVTMVATHEELRYIGRSLHAG